MMLQDQIKKMIQQPSNNIPSNNINNNMNNNDINHYNPNTIANNLQHPSAMFISSQEPRLNNFYRSVIPSPQQLLQQQQHQSQPQQQQQTSPQNQQQVVAMNQSMFLNPNNRFVLNAENVKLFSQQAQQQQQAMAFLQQQHQLQSPGMTPQQLLQQQQQPHLQNQQNMILNSPNNTPALPTNSTPNLTVQTPNMNVINQNTNITNQNTNNNSNSINKTNNPTDWNSEMMLHYYVYDYLVKKKFVKAAQNLLVEAQISSNTTLPIESKDGFLYEWWTLFWELYSAKQDRITSKESKMYLDMQKVNANHEMQNLIKAQTIELYNKSLSHSTATPNELGAFLKDTNIVSGTPAMHHAVKPLEQYTSSSNFITQHHSSTPQQPDLHNMQGIGGLVSSNSGSSATPIIDQQDPFVTHVPVGFGAFTAPAAEKLNEQELASSNNSSDIASMKQQKIHIPKHHLEFALQKLGLNGRDLNSLHPAKLDAVLQFVNNLQHSLSLNGNMMKPPPSSENFQELNSLPTTQQNDSNPSPSIHDTHAINQPPPAKKAKLQRTKSKRGNSVSSNAPQSLTQVSPTTPLQGTQQGFSEASLNLMKNNTSINANEHQPQQKQPLKESKSPENTQIANHPVLFDDGQPLQISIGQTKVTLTPEVQRTILLNGPGIPFVSTAQGTLLLEQVKARHQQYNNALKMQNQIPSADSGAAAIANSATIPQGLFQSHVEQSSKLKEAIADQLRFPDEIKTSIPLDFSNFTDTTAFMTMEASDEKLDRAPANQTFHVASRLLKQDELKSLALDAHLLYKGLIKNSSSPVINDENSEDAEPFNFRQQLFKGLDPTTPVNNTLPQILLVPSKSRMITDPLSNAHISDESKFKDPESSFYSLNGKQSPVLLSSMSIVSNSFLKMHEKVSICAFGVNGRYLLTCGHDGRMCLWDIQSLDLRQPISGMKPSWSSEPGHARLLTGKFSIFPASPNFAETHAMSVCGSDGFVQVYRLQYSEESRILAELGLKFKHSDVAVSCMSFSPLPLMLLKDDATIRPCYWASSVDTDGKIKFWTVCSGDSLKTIELDTPPSKSGTYNFPKLEFKPISTELDIGSELVVHLACSTSTLLCLFTVPLLQNCSILGEVREHFKATPHQKNIVSLQWNRTGTVLMTFSEDTICLWTTKGSPSFYQLSLVKNFTSDSVKISSASMLEKNELCSLFMKSPTTSMASPNPFQLLSSIRILVGSYERIYSWNPSVDHSSLEPIGKGSLMPAGIINQISIGPEYQSTDHSSLSPSLQNGLIIATASGAKDSNVSLVTLTYPFFS